MKKALVLIAALAAALGWAYALRSGAFAPKGKIIKRTRFMMDTLVTIQVPNELGTRRTEAAINRAFDRMAEIERKFNCLNPESPLYKFNESRAPITDPEIAAVTGKALEISRATGGAFDPTVYPLVDLWGFYTTSVSSSARTVPAPARIRAALALAGWRRITVKEGAVTASDRAVRLDLGGIAKGYSMGEAVKELKAAGAKSGLILAGGQVQVFGSAAPGVPWKVGLRNPRKDGYIASLPFDGDLGISTSGDYERFFEEGGVRYHHILDPGTGYPARGSMSVSVITADPAWADALSTALFVMGPRRAAEFARGRGLDVIIVDAAGKVFSSQAAPAGD
ncbi:MAG: FAD:protein FMN transferase [Elusimicrobiales bacterium]|nr:FAD:protein FMN transferase [Elusimicrobiales bacterium]